MIGLALSPSAGTFVAAEEAPSGITFIGEVHGGSGANLLDISLLGLTGIQTGDLLLALVVSASTGANLVASGWTQIGTDLSSGGDLTAGIWRISYAGNNNLTVDDNNETGGRMTGLVLAYRGVNATPIGSSSEAATASGTSHAGGSVTPAAADSMIVTLYAIDADDGTATWTPPTGMDERADFAGATAFLTLGAADVIQASTDAVSKTATSSVAKPGVIFTVALTPA